MHCCVFVRCQKGEQPGFAGKRLSASTLPNDFLATFSWCAVLTSMFGSERAMTATQKIRCNVRTLVGFKMADFFPFGALLFWR